MKKIHYALIGLFIVSTAAILFLSSFTAISHKQTAQTKISVPDDVAAVLRSSCVSCHGAGGNGMAMSAWNFSSWDKYSVKKQAKKAKAICNSITNGRMPPAWVKQSNPDRIPNVAQTEIICKWAGSLKKTK